MCRKCPSLHTLWLALLIAAAVVTGQDVLDAVLTSGNRPLDIDGQDVHAHGGCILHINSTFWWFGTTVKQDPGWISAGIALYSSPDLQIWTNHGMVFNGSQINDMPFPAPYRIERPKVVWNAQHGYFAMLWHLDTPSFQYPAVGVATSPSITGPYQYRHAFKPDGRDSYDMTVFQPLGSSDAYLLRSVENRFLGVSKLTDDYLNTTGICSIAGRQEAPAAFSANGKFYVFSSHLTGWAPNPPMLWSAPNMCGATWTEEAVPAEGPGAATDFEGQATFIFPIQLPTGKSLYVYMGDRWNPYGPGSVANATYIWLPLRPRDNNSGFFIKWETNWTVKDYAWAAVAPLAASNPEDSQGVLTSKGAAKKQHVAWVEDPGSTSWTISGMLEQWRMQLSQWLDSTLTQAAPALEWEVKLQFRRQPGSWDGDEPAAAAAAEVAGAVVEGTGVPAALTGAEAEANRNMWAEVEQRSAERA